MALKTPLYHSKDWVYLTEHDVYDPINKNYLYQSDDLSDTTYWTRLNCTPTASAKTDPENDTNAWKLTKSSATAFDNLSTRIDYQAVRRVIVGRFTFQADGASPSNLVAIQLLSYGGFSQSYVPAKIQFVYGPGRYGFDPTNKLGIIYELSTSEWTEVEVTWIADNEEFVDTQELVFFPGGQVQNSAAIHTWRPHLETSAHPDGLGFRSRGPRKTTTVNGPDGAPGQIIRLRTGTETMSQTIGGPFVLRTTYLEGLTTPPVIGVSGMADRLIGGIARTTVSDMEFTNVDRIRDHWTSYSWLDRPMRIYRGERGTDVNNFERIYTGTSGEIIPVSLHELRLPVKDPLAPLHRTMEIPRFLGFGQCARLDSASKIIDFKQQPSCRILGDLTIQIRLRLYNVIMGTQDIISYDGNVLVEGENKAWLVGIDNNGTSTNMYFKHEHSTGSNQGTNSPLGSLPDSIWGDGLWHDFVWVRDDTAKTVSFWFDGELIGTDTYTTSATGAWNSTMKLGGDIITDGDELRIWNRVLTDQEIAATSGYPIDARDYWNDGLQFYHRFDEGATEFVFDEMTKLDERRMEEAFVSFDGDNDYYRITHANALGLSARSMTWEARVCPSGIGYDQQTATLEYIVAKSQGFNLIFNAGVGKFVAQVRNNANTGWLTNTHPTVYTPGQDGWILVTARWNNNSKDLDIFLDGGDKNTVNFPGENNHDAGNDVFVGSVNINLANSRFWLSELRMFAAAITDGNIAARANAVLTGEESNLKLWHTFDEGKKEEYPKKISQTKGDDTAYGTTVVYDREVTTNVKYDSATVVGITFLSSTGLLVSGAWLAGTGEGYRDLIGKRKPYAAGLVNKIPLTLLDDLHNVYFAALPPMEEFVQIEDGGRPLLSKEITTADDVWDYDFDSNPISVRQLEGTTWTNYTSAAASDTAHDGDVEILHATPGSGTIDDGIYIGFANRTSQIDLWLHTALGKLSVNATSDIELAWQFWNGNDWQDLRGLVDGTRGFRLGGKFAWHTDREKKAIKDAYVKATADGRTFENVANVRWQIPATWVRESLNDIATSMGGVGSPSSANDYWYIRCAAIANPTGYDRTPKVSTIWQGEVDAVHDVNQGMVKFASPPQFAPTAVVKGDNTGSFRETVAGVVRNTIERFYSGNSFLFDISFNGSGPDYQPGIYVGMEDTNAVRFLSPMLAGARSILTSKRDGNLVIKEIGPPEDATIEGSIDEVPDQLLALRGLGAPDPASTLRLTHTPYFTKFTDSDVSLVLPISVRLDILQPWRYVDEVAAIAENATRWVGSEPQRIESYLSLAGTTDTISSELDKWTRMIGFRRRLWEATIPTGLLEHVLGYVAGMLVARYDIWDGVPTLTPVDEGTPFYVLAFVDDYNTDQSTLVLWGNYEPEQ